MAKNRRFIVAFILVCVGIFQLHQCNGLSTQQHKAPPPAAILKDKPANYNCFKQTLESQLGVVEQGQNRGLEVEKYLRYTGLDGGFAWCAALQAWSLGQCSIDNPRSAWSPAMLPKSKRCYIKGDPWPADTGSIVYGIYFPSKKRVAHLGGLYDQTDDKIIGIEGNTNDGGAREGDRVLKKVRPKNTIYEAARY